MNLKDTLLEQMRDGARLSTRQQVSLIAMLSIPAILAQLSMIVMEYIDASMVGQLGAGPAAAIGLVAPLTWVFFGVTSASVTGFSVQVAQLIGAKNDAAARNTFKQGAMVVGGFCLVVCAIALTISPHVPALLGGEEAIRHDAFRYFFIFMCAIPLMAAYRYLSAMLQCTGHVKTPSLVHVLTGILDVIFNFFLIFETREVELWGQEWTMPGAGLGVTGAALGTVLAEAVGLIVLIVAVVRLRFVLLPRRGESFRWDGACLRRAVKISTPIAFEHMILSGALVVTTAIIAPMGAVSLASNSLAVTAESFCYMPGFGIAEAATTLVGQSIGARQPQLAKRFAWMCIGFGMAMMAVTGAILYAVAPLLFRLLSPVQEIQTLGTQILRIEALAEPLYGASIVCTGALRGIGDTLVPTILNLASMWGIRLTLSLLLAGSMGLVGVWIAMAAELCCRGILFLVRVARTRWEHALIVPVSKASGLE